MALLLLLLLLSLLLFKKNSIPLKRRRAGSDEESLVLVREGRRVRVKNDNSAQSSGSMEIVRSQWRCSAFSSIHFSEAE